MSDTTVNVSGSTSNEAKVPLPPMQSKVGTAAEAEMFKIKQALSEMQEKLDAVTEGKPKKVIKERAVDYSKLTEKDIYNFDIPFEVVDQNIPDYMDIVLADSNYVPRWINKNFKRVAVMLRMGWTYIKAEDFDPLNPAALPFDENGLYSCHDAIAVKIPKARLYPILRANYLRSAALKNSQLASTALQANWAKAQSRALEGNAVEGMDPILQKAIELGGVETYLPPELADNA